MRGEDTRLGSHLLELRSCPPPQLRPPRWLSSQAQSATPPTRTPPRASLAISVVPSLRPPGGRCTSSGIRSRRMSSRARWSTRRAWRTCGRRRGTRSGGGELWRQQQQWQQHRRQQKQQSSIPSRQQQGPQDRQQFHPQQKQQSPMRSSLR